MSADSHCEMCGDSGVVQVERIEYVTHDMAIDAGAPEMEGQPQPQGFEDVPCPACSDSPFDRMDAEMLAAIRRRKGFEPMTDSARQ